MSGIYIPGVEMPKMCGDCFFLGASFQDAHWCCWVTKNRVRLRDGEISKDCPLIEVPTPHDDLIGRETAKKTVCRALEVNCKNLMNTAVPMLIDYALNNAPTIIEAESPESEGE